MGDLHAQYVDTSSYFESILRSKDARHSHFPIADWVNLTVPLLVYFESVFALFKLDQLIQAGQYLGGCLRRVIMVTR